MRRNHWRFSLPAIVLCAGLPACDDTLPVQPVNRSPVITSVTVFPTVIGIADSALVICNAMDADADTLVYDWITDSRLEIKGDLGTDHALANTFENSRIFYPSATITPTDTVWVQRFARDRRGKSANRVVTFVVRP